jgi:hypothetical protein
MVSDHPDPRSAPAHSLGGHVDPASTDADPFPHWFSPFLNARQTRNPSAHTMKAYRQDFIAIATLVAGGHPSRLAVTDITKDAMRTAFAAYARDHEAASIRRCWSTWNVLCTFLCTGEQLSANPMQLVGRPKLAKPLPKALPRTAIEALRKPSRRTRNRNAKPTGPNAISRSSLPHCSPASAQTSSDKLTSATSAPPTTAPRSSTLKAKAARNAASLSKPDCSR